MGRPRNSQYDAAVTLYDGGMSIGDIADEYGITRQAMWKILAIRGCEFRPQLRYGQDNHFYRGTSCVDAVHNLVEAAVRQGVLIRPLRCEECGSDKSRANGHTAIHAHHDDYNKPLDVRWLCVWCHHKWHEANVAIPISPSSHR